MGLKGTKNSRARGEGIFPSFNVLVEGERKRQNKGEEGGSHGSSSLSSFSLLLLVMAMEGEK